ncbi:MAG: P-II family nitrogen regulator [Longimicrobiaceae bacterium]
MKEIKLYLRKKKVDDIVHALRDAGVTHMTITHVKSLGSGVDPDHVRISFETGTKYTETAKLEFVCSEPDVDVLIPLIETHARTGEPGDGIIFVSPVDRAVKIRTGVEGREALR